MPSDSHGASGRRHSIVNWRVLEGRREVFSDYQKLQCEIYIRDHKGKGERGEKLRLIPPNRAGRR